jgi:ketosteroid isomerase-like protein
VSDRRPLPDRLEVAAPSVAALVAQVVSRAPARLRARALGAAFDRARDAFNRGDLEAVFALFAHDVEYVPPPPLYEGPPISGRNAVLAFWTGQLERFRSSSIENLSIEEASPGRFVRRASLRHVPAGEGRPLEYVILQTTELRHGRVVRQINELDGAT